MSSICEICDKTLGFFDNKYKIANSNVICAECLEKVGGSSQVYEIKKLTPVEIKNKMIEVNKNKLLQQQRQNIFEITKRVGDYVYIDEKNKLWVIPTGVFSKKIQNSTIYSYNDIIDYELLEDGTTITKGGLGRAVAGGLLFGGVGAVVGGVTGRKKANQVCTSLKIKITLNDMQNPVKYINFISSETPKKGILYSAASSSAQQVISTLQLICENAKQEYNTISQTVENNISVADEIKKFKELLDMGAITQEEFDSQKKELLKL